VTETKSSLDPSRLLAKGGLGAFGMRILALGLAFLADSYLTNTLGLEKYDVWASAASWLTILTVFTGLGMHTAMVRHLPADQAHNRFGEMSGMIRWSARRMLLVGLALGVAIFGARLLIARDQPELMYALAVVGLMVPVQAMNVHRQGVLQAFKRPIWCLMPDQIVRPIALIIGLFLFVQIWGAPNPRHVSWLWLISISAALVAGARLKSQLTPTEVRQAEPRYEGQKWFATAKPLLFLHIAGMLIAQADPAMLGILGEPGQAGLFAVSNRIALLLGFGLAAVNAIAAPLIAQLHAKNQHDQMQSMLTLAAKGIVLFTVPAALFMVFFGKWMLSIFGDEFTVAYPVLMWLVAGQTINALAGSVGFILTMTGFPHTAARIIWVAAIGKVSLNLILMPRWGALGAAIGTALMLAFWNFWLWIEVRKKLDLEPTILSALRKKSAS
jgi:O-antigen/teichoic acid export membrane protein